MRQTVDPRRKPVTTVRTAWLARLCMSILLSLMTVSAYAAGSWLQSAGASALGATSATATLNKPGQAGNTIIACVGSNVPVTSITDNQANSYRLLGKVANSSGAGVLYVYYARPRTAGLQRVTLNHAWGHADLTVSEYQGLLRQRAFKASDTGYNTGAQWASTTVASTTGDQLVGCAYEVYAAAASNVAFSAGPGFAARKTQRGVFVEDRAVTTAGNYAATGSRSPANNLNVVAAIAAFSTGTVIPGPTPTPTVSATPVPTGTAVPTATPTPTALPTVTPTRAPSPTPTQPPSAQTPVIYFIDVASGPVTGGPGNQGVPITLFGRGFGATRGTSRVTIGGVEVASYLAWGERNAHNPYLDMIVVQPGRNVTGGAVAVTVAGNTSNLEHSFTPNTGSVYYIAPGGVDNGHCQAADPCATLSAVATDLMRPGDTVLLRDGIYNESEIWIRSVMGHSGTASQRKVIKNYPGEEAILQNAARPFIVEADYITVSGLNLRNGKPVVIPDSGLPGNKGNRFINNTFTGTIDWGALDTHGDAHQLAGNVCDVAGSTVGTQGHCYYISFGTGNEIIYNIASGAPGYGIHVFDQQRSANDFRRVIRDLRIEGNLLKSSTQRSGMIIDMGDEGNLGNSIENVTVRGNTFTANSHLGLLIGHRTRNIAVSGNRFVENGREGVYVLGDASVNGVSITGNNILQTDSSNCRNDCTWYNLANIEVGPGALNVVINGNYYVPQPAVIVGGSDSAPAATPLNLQTP